MVMNWHKRLLSVAALALVGLMACSPSETKTQLPAVNDENCKDENIKNMADKEMRQELASLCIRRSRFKPSSNRQW
jgi:entry exclusion lipoprotein TrbK